MNNPRTYSSAFPFFCLMILLGGTGGCDSSDTLPQGPTVETSATSDTSSNSPSLELDEDGKEEKAGLFCNRESDCLSDPLTPCIESHCDTTVQRCIRVAQAKGSPCDDSDACTQNETCTQGICSGETIHCPDDSICSVWNCESEIGCTAKYPEETCVHDDLCVASATCQGGECVARESVQCSDNNECTQDSCSPDTGQCMFTPADAQCDDGNPCTESDHCETGACLGSPLECPSQGPCSMGICSPESGCETILLEGPCSDSSLCTIDDLCSNGECIGSPIDCSATDVCWKGSCSPDDGCLLEAKRGEPCKDDSPCTFEETCEAGQCLPGTTFENCDALLGVVGGFEGDTAFPIRITRLHENSPLPAALELSLVFPSESLTLVEFTTELCVDGAPCAASAAPPAPLFPSGHTLIPEASLPTSLSPLAVSVLHGGTPSTSLTEGVGIEGASTLWTVHAAPLEASGGPGNPLYLEGAEATDGEAIPLGVILQGGVLFIYGEESCDLFPALCNDDEICTEDLCAPGSGCVHVSIAGTCNDEDPCTQIDGCAAGQCSGNPMLCEDGNPCTDNICDSQTGECSLSWSALPCLDGDPCTWNDACTHGVCQGNPLPCDDGNQCNGMESCVNGSCLSADIPECGDGNFDAFCGEECDDGNLDSLDGCSDLCALEPKDCESDEECSDENPCTQNTCVFPVQTCESTPLDGPCGEVSVCGSSGMCADGDCTYTGETLCNDSLDCTLDTCTDAGCIHTPIDALCPETSECMESLCNTFLGCESISETGIDCDDENECTIDDQCVAGTCAGEGITCDDGNSCTVDSCATNLGCLFETDLTQSCDDGDSCTLNDLCTETGCEGDAIYVEGECESEAVPYCSITGEAGTVWECPLSLASQDPLEPKTTGMQFAMEFDASRISLIGIVDDVCYENVGCFEVSVAGAGAFPLSSGHSITMAPLTLASWAADPCSQESDCPGNTECNEGGCFETGGFGALVIVHIAVPTKPLTDAVFNEDGTTTGEPEILRFQFEVLESSSTPFPLYLTSVVAAAGSTESLDVIITEGLILTGTLP